MKLPQLVNLDFIENISFEAANLKDKKAGGGIYRMYNNNTVIYVGKSQNLTRRLKQHKGKDTNTSYFIHEVTHVEWLKESNPILQNLLEAIFIAYHKPKYNDEVKDMLKEDFT